MASYTYTQLYGSGSIGENFTSGVEKTFTFTNPSGSSYFTMETIPSSSGFFEASSPKNFSGSFVVSESMGLVTSSYIASIVVQPGTQVFKFTPAITVTGTTYYLRGTGGYSLEISSGGVLSAPSNIDPPFIDNTTFYYVDYTLSFTGNNWDGNPVPTLTYQWLRNGGAIGGETSDIYIATYDDVGQNISVKCTATNSQGTDFVISNEVPINP
jgi:hypothetical protein